MTKPNDMPAFPSKTMKFRSSQLQEGKEPHEVEYEGMTLRDYFANTAMLGIVFRGGVDDNDPLWRKDEQMCTAIAANAYIMADAMLLERSQKDEVS